MADDQPAKPALVLATQGIIPASQYTRAQLAALFPAFKHEPLDSAGFNALSLPFHYRDETGAGDPNEANAFAFLLSNAMDWAPGCYCARHAYFVFDRSKEAMQPLIDQYDAAPIAALVRGWNASHAIGGTLTKTKDGYTGQLEIFDRTGARFDFESFDTPQSYFDLLGEMAAVAMKFFGEPANDALLKHLKTPQCKDPKSLALLGSAAFLPQRSMFAIAQKVLASDPDFAAVRSWAAVQRSWAEGDEAGAAKEHAKALEQYLASEDLRTFQRALVPGLATATWDRWWDDAAKMSPENSPLILINALSLLRTASPRTDRVIELADKACAKYPNNYLLLLVTSFAHQSPQLGHLDGDLAASMYVTALNNNFMTGIGTKTDAVSGLARLMVCDGRPDIAAQLLGDKEAPEDEISSALLQASFAVLGQHQNAMNVFNQRQKVFRRTVATAASCALYSATMLNDLKTVDQIRSRYATALAANNSRPLATAYSDYLSGKPVDTDALVDPKLDPSVRESGLNLVCQLDIAAGTEKYRDQLLAAANDSVDSRDNWIMLDAYDRKHPREESVEMYRMMLFIGADDPWVAAAATEGLRRHANAPQTNTHALAELLKVFPPHLWTPNDPQPNPLSVESVKKGTNVRQVVAGIAQLVDKSEFDAAKDLALRYANFRGDDKSIAVRFWVHHLAYFVEDHRQAVEILK